MCFSLVQPAFYLGTFTLRFATVHNASTIQQFWFKENYINPFTIVLGIRNIYVAI